MKIYKNILVTAIIMILVISLAGCAGSDIEETSMDLSDQIKENIDTEDIVSKNSMAYFANMPDNNYKISQQDFIDKVIAGDDMVILDIRQEDAYLEGHVQGAINVPWGEAISENIEKIPDDKEVFIYCYSGQTAGQAVMTLNLAGKNARSVNLGWNFGISKVEGIEDVTKTDVNEFSDKTYSVDTKIKTALTDYYVGLSEVKDTKFANYKISEDGLKGMIDEGEDFYLLSIRAKSAYEEGHIEGAANIPWGKGMQESFSMLPTDKKIVVYCYTGQTAGQATAGLRLLGYDAVSLNGGMGMESNAPLGWANKGYDVVK